MESATRCACGGARLLLGNLLICETLECFDSTPTAEIDVASIRDQRHRRKATPWRVA